MSDHVYAVIRVQTALRKKDGTIYMTGIEDREKTLQLQADGVDASLRSSADASW